MVIKLPSTALTISCLALPNQFIYSHLIHKTTGQEVKTIKIIWCHFLFYYVNFSMNTTRSCSNAVTVKWSISEYKILVFGGLSQSWNKVTIVRGLILSFPVHHLLDDPTRPRIKLIQTIYSMNELCSLRIEDFMQVLLGGSIESVTASPIKKQKVLLNRMRLQWCNQSPTPSL